jgi:hypothetical protein
MRPRQALSVALLAVVLLAGCAGTSPTTVSAPTSETDAPTATTTDDPTERRPCPPAEPATPTSTPVRPDDFTRENVAPFVRAYEEATVRKATLDEQTARMSVHVSEAAVVERTADGYVLHLEGGFSVERCLDGRRAAGEGVVRANYFVNETALVRLGDPKNRTTDPRGRGTVVERWERER